MELVSTPDIRLFVCCHQAAEVPKHPLLVPIQVGAALTEERFPGFLQDNTGDNISEKNRSYCELTAQYWAWKNVTADYYGFFHYRRYLYPNPVAKLPYRIEREPTLQLLEKLGYSGFEELIQQYDLIIPKGEDMHVPVREHYANAPNHHREDLKLLEQITLEYTPDMAEAMQRYLSDTVCYFGNIFIMKREMFLNYCNWLFSMLKLFDQQADITAYSEQEMRVDGYLAERLLGIYVVSQRYGLRLLELPRVHFCDGAEFIKRRLLNAVLPPGSGRRSLIKRLQVK